MNIGIDIDGVILDSENVFRTVADLYNTIELKGRKIKAYDEVLFQKKYNWTDEEIKYFSDKYFLECSKRSNFMPYVKEVLEMLKKQGHNLIIITARGRDNIEMKKVAEEKFREKGLKFDKYYWGQINKSDACIKENIDIMIDDNYDNCIDVASKNIDTLYFRGAGLKKIENNSNIKEVHNWGEIYSYIQKKEKNYFKANVG